MATLDVQLVTPERVVWTGPAMMVSARGVEGDVGILPRHAPLLIALAPSVLRIKGEGEDVRAVVDGGFFHVSTSGEVTRVDVLASHAELESEVDLEAAVRRKDEWRRRLAELAPDAPEAEAAKLELMKAEARLSLADRP